jgi:hypothetical protein
MYSTPFTTTAMYVQMHIQVLTFDNAEATTGHRISRPK